MPFNLFFGLDGGKIKAARGKIYRTTLSIVVLSIQPLTAKVVF